MRLFDSILSCCSARRQSCSAAAAGARLPLSGCGTFPCMRPKWPPEPLEFLREQKFLNPEEVSK